MNLRKIISCALALSVLVPAAVSAQGARLQLDYLNKLAEKANDTVDVTVDAAMLKQTAGFLAGKGSDPTKVQQLLEGITGIYVKSFKFDTPGGYTDLDVEAVRKQLARPGWARVVGVRENREITEIYLWKERDTNGGLAVIAAQPNELTIVNIVGRVDLASLGVLGPMIPKLPGSKPETNPR